MQQDISAFPYHFQKFFTASSVWEHFSGTVAWTGQGWEMLLGEVIAPQDQRGWAEAAVNSGSASA